MYLALPSTMMYTLQHHLRKTEQPFNIETMLIKRLCVNNNCSMIIKFGAYYELVLIVLKTKTDLVKSNLFKRDNTSTFNYI